MAFDETNKCKPRGAYAEMKHEIEKTFRNIGLFKSIRLSYVFSKNDKFTLYLSKCFYENSIAEVFHPFSRSVIYLNDVTEAVLRIAENWDNIKYSIVNFGGPQLLSRKELAKILKNHAFHTLNYETILPDKNFFKNRPKKIEMTSHRLESIIGRSMTTIEEAVQTDF